MKRLLTVFAMAFTAFVLLTETSGATVLRLKDGTNSGPSETRAVPTPRMKPEQKPQQEAEETATPSLLSLAYTDADGKSHSLKEHKGKVILLNLWATWCGPCVEEMPALSQVAADYKDKGLVVITLSQDDSLEKVKHFFSKLGIENLPAFMDPDMSAFQTLQLRGLPVSLLIDPEGKLIIQMDGFVEWGAPETRKMIESHLPKPAAPSI